MFAVLSAAFPHFYGIDWRKQTKSTTYIVIMQFLRCFLSIWLELCKTNINVISGIVVLFGIYFVVYEREEVRMEKENCALQSFSRYSWMHPEWKEITQMKMKMQIEIKETKQSTERIEWWRFSKTFDLFSFDVVVCCCCLLCVRIECTHYWIHSKQWTYEREIAKIDGKMVFAKWA